MLALGTTPLLCRPSADIRGHVGFYVLPFNRQVDPQRTYSRIRHNSTQNSPLPSVQAPDQQARGDACPRVWAARDRRRGCLCRGCLPWVHPHRGGGGGGCCCQDEAAAAGALSGSTWAGPLPTSPPIPRCLPSAARDSKSRWPVGIGWSTWTAELRAVSHVRGESPAGRRPSSPSS